MLGRSLARESERNALATTLPCSYVPSPRAWWHRSPGEVLFVLDWFTPEGSLPLFIFVAEACVITLATVRTIFVARGMKYLAPLLGFFEVSIWLFAIGQVM